VGLKKCQSRIVTNFHGHKKSNGWEKKHSQRLINIHQSINGNLNGPVINGRTVENITSKSLIQNM